MIVTWWEPEFPYHVITPRYLNWVSRALELAGWLESTYPELEGDKNVSPQSDSCNRHYASYEWGFCKSSFDQEIVFYFKDPTVASHFKLVWGGQ